MVVLFDIHIYAAKEKGELVSTPHHPSEKNRSLER